MSDGGDAPETQMGTSDSEPAMNPSGPLWFPTTRTSEWFEVTQHYIDAFAAATGDDQWIHRSGPDSAANPFGAPIAHGLLLLSLAVKLARDCGALPEATWVLYAFDKLRFRSPARSGVRIRCIATRLGCRELGGRQLLDAKLVIEVNDQKVPALTTNCAFLCLERKAGTPGALVA